MSLASQAASALRNAWSSVQRNNHSALSCTSLQTVVNPTIAHQQHQVGKLETIQQGKSYTWMSILGSSATSVFTLAEPTKPGKRFLVHDDGFRGILCNPETSKPAVEGAGDYDIRLDSASVACVKRTATAELDVLQEQAALVEVSQQVLALLKLTDHQQQSLCVYFHRNFTLNEWITFQVKFQAETLVEGAYFNSHLQRVATVLMESSSVRNEPLSSPHTLPVNPDCVLQRDVLAGMRHKDFGWKATYGGQLLGQGVLANGTSCSSFHQHFIRGGQVNKDSEISLTNGNQVTIKQDGKVIFRAASVLHELPKLANPASPQPAPPAVTTPKAQLEFAMPQYLRDAVFKQMGLEFQLELSGGSFRHRCHVRFANPARALVMNQALLAYVCDFVFPSTAISAHGVSVWEGEAKLMSFSGNFYFLYDVDLSAAGWITLEAHCPVLVNGRALVTIDMFNSDRTQIARGVQEVLVMLK